MHFNIYGLAAFTSIVSALTLFFIKTIFFNNQIKLHVENIYNDK